MTPDLFSNAAPVGAALPIAAAGMPPADAPVDAPAGEFDDFLAASMAPETENAAIPGGYAAPTSLSLLWIGLLTAAPQNGEVADETADETTDSADAAAGEVPLAASADSVPVEVVPVHVVPVDAAPVPVIVQVPTDVMSAAPVQTRSQDASSTPGTHAAVAAALTPQTTAALQAPKALPASQALSPSAETPERPMEAFENLNAAPATPKAIKVPAALPTQAEANVDAAVVAKANVEAPRANAKADVPVSADTKTVAHDTTVAGRALTARQTDAPAASAAPQASAGQPVSEQPVADVPRDAAPSPKTNTTAAVKAQPEQAPQPQQQAQAAPAAAAPLPVAEVPPTPEQAQAVVGRAFTARQDNTAGREGPPYGEMRAAEALVNIAAPQQGGSDASAKDAGKQGSDAAVDIAPAARSTDAPVAPAPAAVAPAVDVTKPAAVQQTPAAPIFTPAQETENLGRLVQGLRVQWRQGVPEATVRLNPEHLGEVTIQIRVERGVVSATFHAETPAVQQWLEAQEDRLRSGLADQGLNLERYAVQRERQQQERREQRQYQQARYRQPRNEGQRFEVTV